MISPASRYFSALMFSHEHRYAAASLPSLCHTSSMTTYAEDTFSCCSANCWANSCRIRSSCYASLRSRAATRLSSAGEMPRNRSVCVDATGDGALARSDGGGAERERRSTFSSSGVPPSSSRELRGAWRCEDLPRLGTGSDWVGPRRPRVPVAAAADGGAPTDPLDLLGREGNHVRVRLGEKGPGKGEVPALSPKAIPAREAREALAHRCAQRREAHGPLGPPPTSRKPAECGPRVGPCRPARGVRRLGSSPFWGVRSSPT
jgi:hypothetical protein